MCAFLLTFTNFFPSAVSIDEDTSKNGNNFFGSDDALQPSGKTNSSSRLMRAPSTTGRSRALLARHSHAGRQPVCMQPDRSRLPATWSAPKSARVARIFPLNVT